MKEYYCIEIDSQGRILDYKASFYRQFDYTWKLKGLKTTGEKSANGYRIDIALPLKYLLNNYQDHKIISFYVGLFRADLNVGMNRKINEHWISWINPKTEEPDFHVPSALGRFQLYE